MTLTFQTVITAVTIVFSIGMAYGVVKVSLKTFGDKLKTMEDDLRKLSDCDDIVRKYLFADNGTTYYVPTSVCLRGHDALDKKFENLDMKIDKILEKVSK